MRLMKTGDLLLIIRIKALDLDLDNSRQEPKAISTTRARPIKIRPLQPNYRPGPARRAVTSSKGSEA